MRDVANEACGVGPLVSILWRNLRGDRLPRRVPSDGRGAHRVFIAVVACEERSREGCGLCYTSVGDDASLEHKLQETYIFSVDPGRAGARGEIPPAPGGRSAGGPVDRIDAGESHAARETERRARPGGRGAGTWKQHKPIA